MPQSAPACLRCGLLPVGVRVALVPAVFLTLCVSLGPRSFAAAARAEGPSAGAAAPPAPAAPPRAPSASPSAAFADDAPLEPDPGAEPPGAIPAPSPPPLPPGAMDAAPPPQGAKAPVLPAGLDPDEVAPPSEPPSIASAPAAALAPGDPTVIQSTETLGAPPAALLPFPALPSLTGPSGLLHASTAEVGRPRTLRLGLHGEYFGADDFLIKGDSDRRLAGGLVVGYSPRRDLELFGALLNSSNRNQRNRALGDRDPEFMKTFGDLILGGKWILPLSGAASFGVELGLRFLSGVSDLSFSPGATSWWLGPLFTYDLLRSMSIPLRFHAGASFYADNSSNLHDFSGATRATKEAGMFAYGMGASRLRVAFAVDAPLENLIPHVPLVPFLEYQLGYVTADADRDFQDYMAPNCDGSDPAKMPCIDNRDLQFLTVGARAAVYRGVTVDLGVDIRIRSPGFPYGPPLPPFNVIFGLSYPFDLDSLTRTVVVTRTVQAQSPPPAVANGDGHLQGTVRSAKDGTPVGGAIVAVVGRPRARAATDADGGFATPSLPAGATEVEVTAADFLPTRLSAAVMAGQTTELSVQLVPHAPIGKVHGRVTDGAGVGLDASLKFVGSDVVELKTAGSGLFSSPLAPGPYQLRVEAAGFAPQVVQVDSVGGQDKELDLTLRVLVSDPRVSLAGGRVVLKKPIRFVAATAQLTPDSEKLLDAVADLLDGQGAVKRVHISAHWDSSLPKAQSVALTRAQAERVRGYLVARGLTSGKLEASGEGASRPLVPNLSPGNRSRNRRVELQVE